MSPFLPFCSAVLILKESLSFKQAAVVGAHSREACAIIKPTGFDTYRVPLVVVGPLGGMGAGIACLVRILGKGRGRGLPLSCKLFLRFFHAGCCMSVFILNHHPSTAWQLGSRPLMAGVAATGGSSA